MNKGLVIVLSAPSGCGKGTIMKQILDADRNIKLSISATTRAPRTGEVDGEDYFFLSRAEFEEMIQKGDMLEHAEYAGNFYGTPKGPVEIWSNEGSDVVLKSKYRGAHRSNKKCLTV